MTNPITNERDGTEVCVSTNCSGDACAYPDCQRDPADLDATSPKRVAMLMSNPHTSAYVRAAMDDDLEKANAELIKAEPLLIGGAVVDSRWWCIFRGKYVRVVDLATHMHEEERAHYVFIHRGLNYFGELLFIGPQLPGESRQVYRARLRKGVKKLSQ